VTDAGLNNEVRHFVIGAMGPEASLMSFRRTPGLGVITGGDRIEIQQAALDVKNLKCLILTGNHRPRREIIERANGRNVPVILAGQNTLVTATICASLLERIWIRPGPWLDHAIDYVRYNIDIDRIMEKATDYEEGSIR